jgi:hypothetical protein
MAFYTLKKQVIVNNLGNIARESKSADTDYEGNKLKK